MSHSSFFYQLYRRSRYSSPEIDTGTPAGSRHQQSEVFAVAALGFVLRYEPKFLDYFLREVCHIPKVASAQRYEIRCQDGNQSDLAIVNPGQQVIVVEAKIQAFLESHQNPTLPEFHLAPKGYGVQINANYPNEPERFYLVLGKELSSIQRGNAKCFSPEFLGFKQWGELEGMKDQSGLIGDFLDCLGHLGIPELQLRSFKSMKLQQSTEAAATIFSLLDGLAKHFKLAARNDRWDVQADSKGKFIGISIPPGGVFGELSKCVGSTAQKIGWFGYESPLNGEPRITVWFYPENKSAQAKTERYVSQRLFPDRPQTREDHYEGFPFYVSRPPDSPKEDVPWFLDVLTKLADVPVPYPTAY